MGVDGKPPFRSVLTHGFVVDGDGRKMSKSLGNVIAPDDIIKIPAQISCGCGQHPAIITRISAYRNKSFNA